MVKRYTGDMQERDVVKNFILSQSAGEIHYLCSETATYISVAEKRSKETLWKIKENKEGNVKSGIISQTRRVVSRH